jgi:hypothetical protein
LKCFYDLKKQWWMEGGEARLAATGLKVGEEREERMG